MADVNSSIGLDASGAIKSISQLQFSIDTINNSIRTLNNVTKGDPFNPLNTSAARARNSISAMEARVLGLRNSLRTASDSTKDAANDITVSWNTILRVVQTQIIVRALSALQEGFVETARAAREFELTIAQTAAIADQSQIGSTFDELAISVRNLAVELGQPIAEVQSAAFQSLQNDIGNTQESLQFLTTANQLAVTTNSELESSVNAITSVLKAYNLDISEAGRISDVFFRTIDVGRVSLDQLENRLGTILPQAAALGISFEQTSAAVSTLTLAGLDTAKATTQLRNIFAKLLRPTKDLQAAFADLGVETGQELIDLYGGNLPDVLRDLRAEFGNSEAAVSNAFGTIRGQLGVLTLLANDASEFQRVLGEFENVEGSVSAAFGEINQTNARQFAREIAQANDTFLGLGRTASQVQTGLLSVFNTVIPNTRAAEVAFAALGTAGVGALVAIAAQSAAAARAVTVVGTSIRAAFGPAGLIIAAVSAAAGVLAASFETVEDQFEDFVAQRDAQARELARQSEENNKQIERDYKRSLDTQERILGDFFKDTAKLYADDSKAFREAQDRIQITLNRTLETFIDSRQGLLDRVDSFIGDIDDKIAESLGRVRDAQQDLEEFRFERTQRGLSDAAQAANELARAQQTGVQAARALATATTEQQRREANELQRTAERRAEAALRSADQLEDARLIAAAENTVAGIIQQRLSAEQSQRSALLNLNREDLNVERDRFEQLNQQRRILAERLTGARSITDEQGRRRSTQEIIDAAAEATRLEDEIEQIDAELASLKVVQILGLEDELDRSAQAFATSLSRADYDFSNALNSFQQQLNQREFSIIFDIAEAGGRSQVGTIQEQLNELGQFEGPVQAVQTALRVRQEELRRQAELRNSISALDKQVSNSIRNAVTAAEDAVDNTGLFGFFENFVTGGGLLFETGNDQARAFGQEIIDQLNRVSQEGEPALLSAREALDDLLQRVRDSDLEQRRVQQLETAIDSANRAFDNFGSANQAREAILPPEQVQRIREELTELQRAAGQFQQNISSAGTETQNLGNTADQVSFNSAQQSIDGLRNRIQAATREAAQLNAVAGGGGGQLAYFGSPVFKNTGGSLTRGQDTRLVSASPGEFITNARSSSRFFAELRAINSGQTPVFREQGGPVTNVGDINVNVDARNSANVDGRQIARSINREIRRGSSTLRG